MSAQGKRYCLFFIIVMILSETRTLAYGDPGSGAMLWQILVAALLGVMFYIRRLIVWVRSVVKGSSADSDAQTAHKEEAGPEPVE